MRARDAPAEESSARPARRRTGFERYQRVAPFYDLLDLVFEYGRYRPLRPQVFENLSGVILDAGVGTGRNMPYYPAGCRVVGIDLSPAMLDRARRRGDRLGRTIDLHEMDVLATSFPDNAFDAVVATFLFCVLEPDQQAPALRELGRICKPGGQIRILEYAYSTKPFRRFVMRLWAPWVRRVYGAAFDRATERYVAEAGLVTIETRFLYKDIIKLIVARPGKGHAAPARNRNDPEGAGAVPPPLRTSGTPC